MYLECESLPVRIVGLHVSETWVFTCLDRGSSWIWNVGLYVSGSWISLRHFRVSRDLDISVAFLKLFRDELGLCHPINYVAGPFLRINISR
jgi:hypothetical protein